MQEARSGYLKLQEASSGSGGKAGGARGKLWVSSGEGGLLPLQILPALFQHLNIPTALPF